MNSVSLIQDYIFDIQDPQDQILSSLPIEVVLHIISYLDLKTKQVMLRVNHDWNHLVIEQIKIEQRQLLMGCVSYIGKEGTLNGYIHINGKNLTTIRLEINIIKASFIYQLKNRLDLDEGLKFHNQSSIPLDFDDLFDLVYFYRAADNLSALPDSSTSKDRLLTMFDNLVKTDIEKAIYVAPLVKAEDREYTWIEVVENLVEKQNLIRAFHYIPNIQDSVEALHWRFKIIKKLPVVYRF